jgi:Uma2 family endonuclease
MSATILHAMLEAPDLPEMIEQAQLALANERKLREKYYADITPEHKWEFIQGEVIMHSPAQNRHLLATKHLFNLMDSHVRVHELGVVHIEKAMTCFPRNDYEPDVMFFGTAKLGLITPDTLRFPIPDLIVEVLSPSTEKRDRGIKFTDYALHGVREYWIIDPVAETVEPHRLEGDAYPPAVAQKDGLLDSQVIAGFEIPVRAIFDEAANTAAMRAIWAQR